MMMTEGGDLRCCGLGEDEDADSGRQIIVGICAMNKKSQSLPMQEILERLSRFEHLNILVFDQEVILNHPVEEWPIVDALISFHSKGFLLNKAVKYVELRKPFVINDIYMQYQIQDRYV